MKKSFPYLLLGFFALWFLSSLRMPKDTTYALQDFAKLPLVANGRFQPMDSLARNSLLQIREKHAVRLAQENRSMPAIEWLAEVMMKPEQADTRKIFRIDHPEVKSMLDLPAKNRATGEDGKHYSWSQLEPQLNKVENEARRIHEAEESQGKEPSQRNVFEQAVMKLQSRLFLYMRLKNTIQPQDAHDFAKEVADYQALVPAGLEAFKAQQAGTPYDTNVLNTFSRFLSRFDVMVRMDTPLLVPPHHPDVHGDDWMRMGAALLETIHGHDMHYAVNAYAKMASAYHNGHVEDFNRAAADYRASLKTDFPKATAKAGSEYVFNHLETFYKSSILYVFAFVLACLSWFQAADWMRRSAYYLIGLAFLVHTAGLLYRMILEGRPPVTNLYSSAIFIGWGAVVLGLVLERIFRDGIGSVVAAAVGFITLVIAHNLALGGDTMEMMRAVLDTNFWLATHVVVITLGYASTFVAGTLAIIYLVRGVFTRSLSKQVGKTLARMVYGIVCFATLFSFVGTVLGGIWADQSWGRFWGWDPKENGALIIVLWNALILHARWGGMVRERGLVNMAIVGNIVTSWSWFGVNMLGIGLHSYGFMEKAFWWLMLFIGSQLLLIGIGCLPERFWRSYSNLAGAAERPASKIAPSFGNTRLSGPAEERS